MYLSDILDCFNLAIILPVPVLSISQIILSTFDCVILFITLAGSLLYNPTHAIMLPMHTPLLDAPHPSSFGSCEFPLLRHSIPESPAPLPRSTQ